MSHSHSVFVKFYSSKLSYQAHHLNGVGIYLNLEMDDKRHQELHFKSASSAATQSFCDMENVFLKRILHWLLTLFCENTSQLKV